MGDGLSTAGKRVSGDRDHPAISNGSGFDQANCARLDQGIKGLGQALKPAAQPSHQRPELPREPVPDGYFSGFPPLLQVISRNPAGV